MRKPYFLIFIFLFFFPLCTVHAQDENFDPNYIVSDDQLLDYSSMTLDEVKDFLLDRGSYLATYFCADPEGNTSSAAEIIYDRAVTNKISPKFLLVLLQKEQGLIEKTNPSQSNLDWATGYGCPDGSSCNTRWQGFWKQVNSASLQFKDYMDNPRLYTYKIGGIYEFSNPYSSFASQIMVVSPQNQATAALYNYTPHVYNGNYNVFVLWHKYFASNIYPNGSLLQIAGDKTVWLIQNGKKRAFANELALNTRFDTNKVITVEKSDLDTYSLGAPIKYPQYSLLRSPDQKIYLIVDDNKRLISDDKTFRKIGFNSEEVIDASWEDINSYNDGKPLTATSTYATGALLQDKKTGGVYWVYEDKKSPLLDKIFLTTMFKGKKITAVDSATLDKYTTSDPVKFDNGELLKSPSSSGVFLIADGQKRPFGSGEYFEKLGYKWSNIISVPTKILDLYPWGPPVSESNND